MKHPPYPLRPNKAVDRLMLLEVVKRLERRVGMANYTYYSLGGPYLEDFRVLYEVCPQIAMTSIEADAQTLKRQKFHRPCNSIDLWPGDLKSFISQYEPEDRRSIFWLDYTDLDYDAFDDFMVLLGKVADESVIKITLRAQAGDYKDDAARDRFQTEFADLLPSDKSGPPNDLDSFAALLQEMLEIASQQALPSGIGRVLQPLCSFCYEDGVGMFTFTGIVCDQRNRQEFVKLFNDWRFQNLRWKPPIKIDVPYLSTKERMHLQSFLPCYKRVGSTLHKALGYIIDNDRQSSADKLVQYSEFHRYYPHFIKASP